MQLREVTDDDLEMLREHRNRPDTRVWLGHSSPISSDQQRAWWATARLQQSPALLRPTAMFLIARDPDTQCDVGLVRISDITFDSACVGSDVFAEHRGKGYGYAVFAAACARAEQLGARHLWLKVFIENLPAVRIYKKAHFSIDQDAPVEVYYRPTLRPAMRYATSSDGFIHYVTMRRHSA